MPQQYTSRLPLRSLCVKQCWGEEMRFAVKSAAIMSLSDPRSSSEGIRNYIGAYVCICIITNDLTRKQQIK